MRLKEKKTMILSHTAKILYHGGKNRKESACEIAESKY